MKFIDALNAKIVRIRDKATEEKALIDAKANAEISDLQAIIDTGDNWLQKQSDPFYAKVSHVMDKIRE